MLAVVDISFHIRDLLFAAVLSSVSCLLVCCLFTGLSTINFIHSASQTIYDDDHDNDINRCGNDFFSFFFKDEQLFVIYVTGCVLTSWLNDDRRRPLQRMIVIRERRKS